MLMLHAWTCAYCMHGHVHIVHAWTCIVHVWTCIVHVWTCTYCMHGHVLCMHHIHKYSQPQINTSNEGPGIQAKQTVLRTTHTATNAPHKPLPQLSDPNQSKPCLMYQSEKETVVLFIARCTAIHIVLPIISIPRNCRPIRKS